MFKGDSIVTHSARIGPALIFDRLWQSCSLDKVLSALLADRRFEFFRRAGHLLTVLHRLFAPGSDRAAEKWKDDYAIEGVGDLDLHHLYRAMAWLGEELAKDRQDGATPFGPRTNKDLIEEALFARRRDLFSTWTSYSSTPPRSTSRAKEARPSASADTRKDHRPDLKQMVVGMVLDRNGDPICSELWPGNTADVKSTGSIVERLKEPVRNRIGVHCCRPRDDQRQRLWRKWRNGSGHTSWACACGVRRRPRRWWRAPAAMRKCIPKATTATIPRR